MKVKIEVKQHQGYTEWASLPKGSEIRQMFGRHQFIYTLGKYSVSLVELKAGFDNKWSWEIYCLRGSLFEDCERFDSKQEAENRIILLLNDSQKKKVDNERK